VRALKAVALSQSTGGSSFVPSRLEDQQEIEMLKESLRQWDEEMRQWDDAMRQRDDFHALAFT
jgi:hypothetical protein